MGNIGENMANKRRSRKAPELSPEAVAANAAGEARREKEKKARRANAEKQRRFRENMKADGFRQVLLWDFPCPADVRDRMAGAGFRQSPAWEAVPGPGKKEMPLPSGMVKVAAAVHETSIGIADRAPEIHKALSLALCAFLREVEKLPRQAWGNAYQDIQDLLRPLGKL
jgi:hypothetical protein